MTKTIDELRRQTVEAQKAQRAERNKNEAAIRAADQKLKQSKLEAEIAMNAGDPMKGVRVIATPPAPPASKEERKNAGGAK